MKYLSKLKYFFHYLWNFWTIVKFRGFQRSLTQAIADQTVDKIIYKDIIVQDIRKALRIDARSKYIPDDHKNKEEIKVMIEARHGERMKSLNITITNDLRLV